jgi:transposase
MYPSDLTDIQWTHLESMLQRDRGGRHAGGRPRKYALRRVVDALLYVVKTGCQWRQLSANFFLWLSVHQQFRAWRDDGAWERVARALREQYRRSRGRNTTPTVAIIDAQSAMTTEKGSARLRQAAGGQQPQTKVPHWPPQIVPSLPNSTLLFEPVLWSWLFGQFSPILKWKLCVSVQAAIDSVRQLK